MRMLRSTARATRNRAAAAMTLIEVVISIGVLSLTSMGGVSAFFLLNKYASNLRALSMARALCQERIEQAMTLPFRPANSVVPLAPSADPINTASRAILGATTNYSSTGAFSGGANYQTSTETIPVYTQSEGTAAANSANITYTRTSTVSPTTLVNTSSAGATATSLNVVQFTVTVSYVFRGQTYTTSVSTLRSPD